MKRSIIRITESDLHKIIKESVSKIIGMDSDNTEEIIDSIINQIDLDRLVDIGETCIASSMLEGEYFDIDLNEDEDGTYGVQITYMGSPYTDRVKLRQTTMEDLKGAIRKALRMLPNDILTKMGEQNLWQ